MLGAQILEMPSVGAMMETEDKGVAKPYVCEDAPSLVQLPCSLALALNYWPWGGESFIRPALPPAR